MSTLAWRQFGTRFTAKAPEGVWDIEKSATRYALTLELIAGETRLPPQDMGEYESLPDAMMAAQSGHAAILRLTPKLSGNEPVLNPVKNPRLAPELQLRRPRTKRTFALVSMHNDGSFDARWFGNDRGAAESAFREDYRTPSGHLAVLDDRQVSKLETSRDPVATWNRFLHPSMPKVEKNPSPSDERAAALYAELIANREAHNRGAYGWDRFELIQRATWAKIEVEPAKVKEHVWMMVHAENRAREMNAAEQASWKKNPVDLSRFDQAQVKKGIAEETKEHGAKLAPRVVADHLKLDPRYYSRKSKRNPAPRPSTQRRELREKIRLTKLQAKEEAREIRRQCKLAREELTEQRREFGDSCRNAVARTQINRDRKVALAQRAIAIVQADENARRIARGGKGPRRTAAEKREESDHAVAANLPAELWPVWQRVKSRIRGSANRSRTEAFLEWLEAHRDEVAVMVAEAAEADVDRMVREYQEQGVGVNPLPVGKSITGKAHMTRKQAEKQFRDVELPKARGSAKAAWDAYLVKLRREGRIWQTERDSWTLPKGLEKAQKNPASPKPSANSQGMQEWGYVWQLDCIDSRMKPFTIKLGNHQWMMGHDPDGKAWPANEALIVRYTLTDEHEVADVPRSMRKYAGSGPLYGGQFMAPSGADWKLAGVVHHIWYERTGTKHPGHWQHPYGEHGEPLPNLYTWTYKGQKFYRLCLGEGAVWNVRGFVKP